VAPYPPLYWVYWGRARISEKQKDASNAEFALRTDKSSEEGRLWEPRYVILPSAGPLRRISESRKDNPGVLWGPA
jgi:hypothetical protein